MSDSQPLPRHNPFQLLKLSFRLYCQYWREFGAIVGVGYTGLLLLYLIYLVLSFGASFTDFAEALTGLLGAGAVSGGIILVFIGQVLVRATVTRRVVRHLAGESTPVEVDGRLVFGSSGILLVTQLIGVLLIAPIVLFGFVPLIGWLIAPGLLIVFVILTGLAVPTVVIERQVGVWVLARAWGLVRQHLLVAVTLFLGLGTILVVLTILVITLMDQRIASLQFWFFLWTVLLALVYLPYYAIAMTLLYVELRVRTEDFEYNSLKQSLDEEAGHAPQPTAATLPAAYAPGGIKGGKLITFAEVGKFVLTGVGTTMLLTILMTGFILTMVFVRPMVEDSVQAARTIGAPAPDFTLTNLDGHSVTLSRLAGKPTLINIWATWCPPCRRELPVLQAAYNQHRQEVNFIMVSSRESRETVENFARQQDLTFPIYLDPHGEVGTLYQIRGVPTSFFVDAEGAIVDMHVGGLDEAALNGYIERLLEPK